MRSASRYSVPASCVKFRPTPARLRRTIPSTDKMAAPTADEILELYDELNFPSAPKLRAALLKKGFRARIKDVEAFVKAQTPTQLCAKGPKYRGHIISSRVNERWAIDFIDLHAEPDGDMKYILMVQDIHSRKIWAKALAEKKAIRLYRRV